MTSRSRPLATPSPFSFSTSNSMEQETQHLSAAAYMRSLVRQLSPSSSTARSNTEHLDTMSGSSTTSQDQQQQCHALKPQMKKQTRKRVPTSRPYQDRLHNMAEARREIVTALRIHRANMRHQQARHRQPRFQPPVHQVMFQEQSQAFEGVPPVALSYASSSSNIQHLSSPPLVNLIAGATPAGPSSMPCYDLTPLEGAPAAAICGQLMEQSLARSLPAQPLGLNLSFRSFGDSVCDANNGGDPFGVPLIQSSSSCPVASSYSAVYPPSPVATVVMAGHGGYSSAGASPAALSEVLDGGDGEMFYSIGGGELSQAAAAASAWWTKIFESMESGSGGGVSAGAPPQTTTGAEVGMTDDDVLVAADLPEWQWLCDGDGVEQEEVTAAGPKPGVVETNHVGDGDGSGCNEGDRAGDNGGGDIGLPWEDSTKNPIMLSGVDIAGWDDGEWFS